VSFQPRVIALKSKEELYSRAISLRDEVDQYKLIVIQGIEKLSKEEFSQFSKIVSRKDSLSDSFLSWDFGHVMELKENEQSENYLFSKERVPFHWDGAFHEVPNILVFNSLVTMKSGKTIFFNTESVLSEMSSNEISKLENISILYETEKIAHYGGALNQRVIDKHPISGKRVIRLGEEVKSLKNPVTRRIEGLDSNEAIKKLEKLFYKQRHHYAHEWNEGDIVLADNFSLLHGREEFTNSNVKRHLRRIQIK